MLDSFFMKNVEKYIENDHYIIWKFPAAKDAYEKQARPLLYLYSIMTRAYGTWFNEDSFITYFNDEGFDVYLVDWGKSDLFTLSGWTLDGMADIFEKQVIDPLLDLYHVKKLNVFAICIGGLILTYLINNRKYAVTDKLHRVAYYGVPNWGERDLGMAKTFRLFYELMDPYRDLFKNSGLSLFFLNMLILYSASPSMIDWSWGEYLKENKNGSLANIINWTLDDRWVPFSVIMDILEISAILDWEEKHDYHFNGCTENMHFLSIVGMDDQLVSPSSSIIEWNSPIPGEFKSFQQMIIDTDHFMFSRPGFKQEKTTIAWWFAGYDLSSLIHKLKKNRSERFVKRSQWIVKDCLTGAYQRADRAGRINLGESLNKLLKNTPIIVDIGALIDQFVNAVSVRDDEVFYDDIERMITPVVAKYQYRHKR